MPSAVYMICDAYEAGVGKGRDRSTDQNPYPAFSPDREAWDIGYQKGEEMAASAWRPINEAPKDGSRFLAVCDGVVGFFHWQDFKDGGNSPVGWRDDFIAVYREGEGPTHFLEIPAIHEPVAVQAAVTPA